MERVVIKVDGMSCMHCVKAVTNAAEALPGIGSVSISLDDGTATVEHDPGKTSVEAIKAAISEQGYDVQ